MSIDKLYDLPVLARTGLLWVVFMVVMWTIFAWMLWGDKHGDSTWVWGLYPVDETHTRLITRVRVKYHWLSPTIIFGLLVEFTDIIMMRKCMLGIQRRAERLTSDSTV